LSSRHRGTPREVTPGWHCLNSYTVRERRRNLTEKK
jgi:hypothetical protein